jgi:putative ABC transport system permease protein
MNDLKFAARQLTRSPGFTAVALVTLAIGIGACAAIFSVVNGVLLRPLAFPESDRVVAIQETFLPRLPQFSVASGKYFVWQEQSHSFESLAAYGGGNYNLTGAGEPERLLGLRVTANMLATYRVQPLLGRSFTAEEDTPGKNQVAILSHGLWQRRFGGRPEVLGSTIQLDGRSHVVVGIMPRRSPISDRVELITPMAFDDGARRNFGGHSTSVIGRLKPGATVPQVVSELAVIQQRIGQEHAEAKGWGIRVQPMLEATVGDMRPVLLSLLGAVGLLLLIACANVANLLLARATARAKEVAVRAAVGANRRRIVRQLLVESVLLGLLGGALGVLVAWGGLNALLALAPENLPRLAEVTVDLRALAFTCALAILTGLGFGLAPAIQAASVDLNRVLKESARGASPGGGRGRLRGALVVSEVALALMLLAGAGLLMRSFARLAAVSPGFRPAGATVATMSLPRAKFDGPGKDGERVVFATEVLRRLAALPGVTAVGLVQNVPFSSGQEHRGMEVEGKKVPIPDMPITNHYTVSADYAKAMGIPLVRGRFFDERDRAGGKRVALINETVARRLFADQDPLGKRISITNGPDEWREIVGVVGDIKNTGLDREVTLQTYEPWAQKPSNGLNFVLRTSSEVPGLHAAIRSAIYAVDPQQPVGRIRPLDDFVAESLARARFAMSLFAVFSGVALLLAGIGIYGVMAYSISQRTSELGIRMALGAQTGDVVAMVFRQGGRLIAAGLAIGLAAALILTRFLESMLYGVRSYDPVTFVAIVAVLAAIAALACLLPARRAARVDPLTALRAE